jgi:hypothetical protein
VLSVAGSESHPANFERTGERRGIKAAAAEYYFVPKFTANPTLELAEKVVSLASGRTARSQCAVALLSKLRTARIDDPMRTRLASDFAPP